MNKYQFFEPRKYDALRNGMFRCYYNEEISRESQETQREGEEPVTEEVTKYTYDAVDVPSLDYGEIVDAIIRTRYSQSAVEAIMRHKLAGVESDFDAFNDFAEWAKTEAERVLAE